MAGKQKTNLKLVAKGAEKPREQTLKQILKLVDGWIYGAAFNSDIPDVPDLVDETFEQIGIDSYFHDWSSDYKDPADIAQGGSLALSTNRPGKLLLAIIESLPTETLKENVADLKARAYWRAFFMARGGFAVGVFLGLRMAGAPEALIERIGRQFVDRD